MLNIIFGPRPERIVNSPARTFDHYFERDWFLDQLVRDMILDVDRSEVLRGTDIESQVLGPISYRELSGGVKGLILMLYCPTFYFVSTSFGDNCCKWIMKIAERQDIYLYYKHMMDFADPFSARVVNEFTGGDIIVSDGMGLLKEWIAARGDVEHAWAVSSEGPFSQNQL